MALKRISYLTLFPEAIDQGLSHSLVGKARSAGKVTLDFVQIRDFAKDKHRSVDDVVFGGGAGMLLKPDVLRDAWQSVSGTSEKTAPGTPERPYTVLLSPQGKCLTQERAKRLAEDSNHLILVCGHYEGVDERFIDLCVDEELSIGDYVLTGGEYAALVVSDVVIRLLPGVVGNESSVLNDSLEDGLLKAPQYTRPREFEGRGVPEVLLSGNHGKVEQWRKEESLRRTREKRPDLFEAYLRTRKS